MRLKHTHTLALGEENHYEDAISNWLLPLLLIQMEVRNEMIIGNYESDKRIQVEC